MEPGDLKYFWAAAQSGKLGKMALPWDIGLIDKETFKREFPDHLDQTYHAGWMLFGKPTGEWPGKDELMPVGAVFGNWVHSVFFMVDTVWFPWASRRNVVETMLQFLNDFRKEAPLLEFALPEDKKFFEVMCRFGVMKRIGTSHSVYPKTYATVFEARML